MAGPTLAETRSIIKNDNRLLCVHYTAETTGGGNDETVHTIVDLSDASNFKEKGTSLASDGFKNSKGDLPTNFVIQKLWMTSHSPSQGAGHFLANLEWISTAGTPIICSGTQYANDYIQHIDFTPMSGFGNPRESGSTGDIGFRSSGMGTSGDMITVTLELTKVF